jgi:hypothetical protein
MYLLTWQVVDPTCQTPAVFYFTKKANSCFHSTKSSLLVSLRKSKKKKSHRNLRRSPPLLTMPTPRSTLHAAVHGCASALPTSLRPCELLRSGIEDAAPLLRAARACRCGRRAEASAWVPSSCGGLRLRPWAAHGASEGGRRAAVGHLADGTG